MDVTEHRTDDGKVYLAVVLDAWSRRIVGWFDTSWAFGRQLRAAGLLGSVGSIGDAYDNSLVESFFGTLQRELLDQHHWRTRHELARAIFEWIDWYNPRRRLTSIDSLSPIDYETRATPAITAA